MELFNLQQLISNNECPKFLIFLGEDYALAQMYIDLIAKRFNLVKRDAETLQEVFTGCIGNELYPEDKLFIMKYQKEAASKEELWSKISENLKSNMLIMVFNELDKRTKFYTQNKENIVSFEPQDDKVFANMAKSNTKLNSENFKELSKICKNNYGKFLTEFDKVKNYAQANNVSEDEAFERLVSAGTIYTGNKDVVFDFVNKVMDANVKMYEQYLILKKQGQSNISLVSLLYSAMRNQFIVQTVASPNQNSTGLAPFIISTCLRRKGKYTDQNLREALRLLQKVEQGVKMGLFEEQSIIDYFMAELLL